MPSKKWRHFCPVGDKLRIRQWRNHIGHGTNGMLPNHDKTQQNTNRVNGPWDVLDTRFTPRSIAKAFGRKLPYHWTGMHQKDHSHHPFKISYMMLNKNVSNVTYVYASVTEGVRCLCMCVGGYPMGGYQNDRPSISKLLIQQFLHHIITIH